MSAGNNFEINNKVSGGAQQQNIGQSGGEATMNVTQGDSVTFEQFAAAIKEAIPEADRERVVAEVVEPLADIANQPPPDDAQERSDWKAKIYEYAAKLEPYAPYLRKTLAAFAEGALKTIPPPASWVVGGVMEVVKDHRKD